MLGDIMQIASINNNQFKYNQTPNFKSAMPVFMQIATDLKTIAPVVGEELNTTLRIKTEYLINNSLKRGINPERDALSDRIRKYMKSWVHDFRGKVAAFTCVDGEFKNGELKPYFYFLTGDTIKSLEKLRLNHKNAVKDSQGYRTADLKIAKDDYYNKGKRLVLNAFKNFQPFGLKNQALFITYEPVRNTKGIIKDYKLINAEFKSVNDLKNPAIKLDKLV